jgi:phage gpG-like protein
MFLRLTHDDISPALTRMIKAVKAPERRRILRAMGTTFKSITEGTFNSVGASYRPEPWKSKHDGSASNLQKSTTMVKSFHLEVTDDFARLSNPTKYSAIHQFGGVIRAKGKALSWVGSDGKRIFAKQVNIPARPFYPVSGERLTPMAEEKISRAAQRVLDNVASGK